jgi:hypothetical protein
MVEWGFYWGFAKNVVVNRGFLHGKRGEDVVICMAADADERGSKDTTVFSDLFSRP